jgi:TRAP-type C4-dicarboxylate transport system permease small subunit
MDFLDLDFSPPQESGFNNLTKTDPQKFMSAAIQALLVLGVIIFFFMLLSGGIKWMTSQGNPAQMEGARKTITAAVVGLVIVFSIFVIIMFINAIFGIDIGNLGSGQFGEPTPIPPAF